MLLMQPFYYCRAAEVEGGTAAHASRGLFQSMSGHGRTAQSDPQSGRYAHSICPQTPGTGVPFFCICSPPLMAEKRHGEGAHPLARAQRAQQVHVGLQHAEPERLRLVWRRVARVPLAQRDRAPPGGLVSGHNDLGSTSWGMDSLDIDGTMPRPDGSAMASRSLAGPPCRMALSYSGPGDQNAASMARCSGGSCRGAACKGSQGACQRAHAACITWKH